MSLIGLLGMLKKLNKIVFSNDDIDLDGKNSDIATFFFDGMSLVTIGLSITNLDDDYCLE